MSQFQIRVYNKVQGNWDNSIYRVGSDLEISEPDAILVRSEKLKDMPLSDKLLAIARAGAGTDNIPIGACSNKGIAVFNTPGANANAVKELVIWAIISASRNAIPALNWMKKILDSTLEFDSKKKLIEAEKKQFQGNEIAGKTVLVIGLGAIGTLVAESLAKLGMNVWGYDPYLKDSQKEHLTKSMCLIEDLEKGIVHADFITIHTELTKETTGLLTYELLQRAKRTCIIINFARAEIIDQTALMYRFEEKSIACYISDFIHPNNNFSLLNAFYLPHLGASTVESEENCASMAIAQLRDFLENGNITNSKNFPNFSKDWDSRNRLLITNKNIPGQIAAISELITQAGLNIIGMANSSKETIAYNIIDLDLALPESLLQQISTLPEILKVRSIIR
ncbi:MAG: 3-phosphoglycerate dehydrogenase family protein [Candidatus Parcubacteria bacterium]|nr:3-phosphoglycerate dehydrogenase family protein [Candidatus Parcubacteria bacterium]